MNKKTSPITPREMDAILAQKANQLKMIRLFDILASGTGLILLSPIFLVIAGLIRLNSKGPAFYRQTRIGKDEKPFEIVKFRSMKHEADQEGPLITAKDDRRITRLGSRLRRLKLDELPQLFNVLKGEMSLVGPRPEVKKYVEQYDENARQVLRVRPGVTDLASIAFFDEQTILSQADDLDEVYIKEIVPAKHGLNYMYIRNMSLPFNLKVIFLTLRRMLKRS